MSVLGSSVGVGSAPQRVTARKVLAASRRLSDVTALHPSPPTVTLSAVSAATSISGGVRIAPKRAGTTLVDTAADPHFEYVGQRVGQFGVSATDMSYPNLLTGGSSQNARDRVRIRFEHTGAVFEAYVRMRGTTFTYRVWVDGLPHQAAYTSASVTSTGRYMLKVDFGSIGTRIVELDIDTPEFGGVYIEPTASLTRSRLTRPTLMGFGDSITQGANGVTSGDAWPRWASQLLGCDWVNTAIGGTGYLASNGGVAAFRQRLAVDVIAQAPDVLVVFGGYNDVSQGTTQQIQDEATYVLGQLRGALPATVIIAVGDWFTTHAVNVSGLAADNAIKAAATASGCAFVSLMDPTQTIPTTAAWSASTAYLPGDQVVANGWVQKCIVGHTSGASFVQTNWRATTFVTGTGKTSATVGDGNADVIVGADGIHPSADGHRILGYHLWQEITRVLRVIAG